MNRTTLLLAAIVLGALGAAPATAQTVLKFSHYMDTSHAAHASAMQFAAKVAERTKGQVKVDVFSGSQLGAPPEQLQQVKLGTLDMGVPTQGQLDKYEKAFAAVMMPFTFADYAQAHRTLDGPVMAWLAPLAEKQGFVILSNWELGFRNLTTAKKVINTPDDVKGLKIRVPPEVQLEATMEALGAQVTKIAFPELYMALSQGVVDGQENPYSVILSAKVYEVQKNLAVTRHMYNSMVHVMNLASWNKLTPEQQKIVREESVAAGNLMRKAVMNAEEEQLAKLQQLGMQVTRPDLATFRARMGPANARISSYAGEANVKKFLELVGQAK
jgi:tripartite ATP-independent transporter DctP family solute receptor